MFGKIPHGGGAKTLLPEKPRSLFDDHLFFGAVPLTLNFGHDGSKYNNC
jgi:hypothetical protein